MTNQQAKQQLVFREGSKIELITAIILSVGTFLYYFFPLFYYGENAVVRVNDFLDGDFVYRIVLVKSHTIFALNPMTPVNNIMNGLPRACLPSGLNIYQLIIFFFPNFYGFLINYISTHLIGFIGMYLFLKNHILKQSEQKPLVILVALTFSILPIYTTTGLAVIGIPLLVNALLFIQKGEIKMKYYIAIVLYSFYCFYTIFPIIIIAAGIYFIWDLIRYRKFNKNLFSALSLLVICLLLSEYQIIYTFVFHKIIPHRLVKHHVTSLNYKGVFIETLIELFTGIVINSVDYPVYLVWLSLLLTGMSFFLFKSSVSLQLKLFLLTFLVGLGIIIWSWHQFQFLFDKYPFFNMFNFKRINCFLPFLVYILFAASIGLLDRKVKLLKFILVPIILFSTLRIDYSFDHSDNADYGKLTYRQFFSEKLFKEIAVYIGKPQQSYRVCDVGLLPSVSQYNGFYTLDSYQYLYPMSYFLQFIKVIRRELNKSATLTAFFNNPSGGANFCFTLSAEEFDARIARKKINEINTMDLDYDALKSINCQYIFSLYNIRKFTSSKIVFEKEFANSEAPFNIYLYKVI